MDYARDSKALGAKACDAFGCLWQVTQPVSAAAWRAFQPLASVIQDHHFWLAGEREAIETGEQSAGAIEAVPNLYPSESA